MKKIQTFIYVLLMGFAFAACQDDSLGGTEQGGIRIALTDGTAGVDVTTRSTPSELFDGFKQKFKFQIKGGDNYDQTHDWTDEVIPLAAGVYDITATCGTEQADGVVQFDKPCYTGTKEGLKVNAGEETKAEIKCEVINALVSIKFANEEEFETYCPDASIQISVGGATEKWANLKESAYFKAGSSLSTLQLCKSDQEDTRIDLLKEARADIPNSFAAGDHLIITLSIAKANGNVKINVSKVEVKKITIEETIPLEWLPKPKMEIEGFTDNQLVMYESETPTAKFKFNLSSGLQELKFSLNFADETYKSLNKEYALSTLSESDRQALTNAGVVLPSIGAKGDVSLDFSGLTAKLTGATDGSSLDNVITLAEVKANNRVLEEGEQTYTIQTHAPEFDIKVYPGNTWTKQFTANTEITKGNAEVIRKNMTFEYSTNGSNWTSSKDSLIAGLTPGTAYQVRAKFGKHVTEVAEVKTYPVIPLKNGDMEDWNLTRTKETGYILFVPKSINVPRYYPYVNTETDPWWTTNMERAVIWSVAPIEATTCPNVSYVTDAHTGNKAAEIRTSGHGGGYATTYAGSASVIYEESAFAGRLFIGTYKWEDDKEVQTLGHTYASKPKKLAFWYKYKPFKTDAFKVEISLKSENTVLAEAVFISDASSNEDTEYKYQEIEFEYKEGEEFLNLEPTSIYVSFMSTKAESFTKNEQFEVATSYNLADIGNWECHIGSRLKIDDVSLIYDGEE